MIKSEIIVECRSTPDVWGYPDTAIICIDGHLRYACDAGACPNGPTGKWGWLDECETSFECVMHDRKYGKCILLNNGLKLPSRVANNAFHNGDFVVDEVFIHQGDTDTNRGSKSCITIPKRFWIPFMSYFSAGDKGVFRLVNLGGIV
jgi:hypothetical protein